MDEIKYENLQLLADELKTIPQKDFSMAGKPANDYIDCVHFVKPKDRGKPLAHAAYVKGLEPIDDDYDDNDLDYHSLNFSRYSKRVFGMRVGTKAWRWCFTGEWKSVDNTPKGAASRIEHLIKHNNYPSNSDGQILGLERAAKG